MDASTSFSFSQCAKDNNKNKSEYQKNEVDIKKLKKNAFTQTRAS